MDEHHISASDVKSKLAACFSYIEFQRRYEAKELLQVSRARVYFMLTCFMVGFGLVSFRLCDVAVFSTERFRYRGIAHTEQTALERANIVDRNGVLLAVNLPTASIYAHPQKIANPIEAAHKIVEIFPEMNEKELIKDFSSEKRFVWVKRNVTPKEQYAINHLGIPGIQFEHEQTRVYPYGNLFSHLIGFTGVDGEGLAGIEKTYDDVLRGSEEKEPQALQLSIDVRVQDILREEMLKTVIDFKAVGASGIVLDVSNGEVVGMVSLPDFDPHNPGHGNPDHLFNRSTMALYEMGSIFKTISLALALDSKKIKMKDTFDVSEPLRIARYKISDYHRKTEPQTVPEIFMYSSNIGTGKIALEVGALQQQKFLKDIGLMEHMQVEVPERAHPLFPKEQRWGDVSTVTISYGHGIAVTPLHFAQAVAPVVNGGIYYPATILKRPDQALEGKRVLKEESSNLMRKLLRLTVKYGTGKRANVAGYIVGGKTGTGNKPDKGGYNRNSRTSSFISAFPMHKPRYVVLMLLDEPKGNESTRGFATAGLTAAPAVGRMIKRIAPILNVPPANAEEIDAHDLWLEFKKPTNKAREL